MSDPCVSVVVPFFNQQRLLPACIEALLAQKDIGGPVQIVLVDNASTDGSVEVANRYPQAELVHEGARGVYAARNAGIRRARAPLIAFTDADCVAAPDWLQVIRAGMSDPSVGVLAGATSYGPSASRPLKWLAAYEHAKAEYVTNHCPPAYHFVAANNMAVRASLFTELGSFEPWERAADTEFVHRVARHRPDQRLRFERSMRVAHLEFERCRDRLKRLRLYTQTNARIPTFKELGPAQRVSLLMRLISPRASEPAR